MIRKGIAYLQQFHPIVHTLLLGTVLITLADSMSILFLPIYLSQTLHMDPVLVGLMVGAGPLAATFGGFFAGALSDIVGRRIVMVGSLLVYALAMIGLAISTHHLLLFLLIVIKGLCASFFTPVSKALMGDVTEEQLRLRVFSLRYLAVNIAYAVGPFLGVLLGLSNDAVAFIMAAAVYLLYTVVLQQLLTRFGIRELEKTQRNLAEQMSVRTAWLAIRRDTALLYLVLAGMLSTIVHGQWSVPLSQYLENNFIEGMKLFAILLSVNAIGVIVLQLPLTRWAEKRPPLTAVILGSILFAAGMTGFAFADNEAMFILFMVVFTVGEILVVPAEYIMIDRITPEGLRGTYYGSQNFTSLGSFFGPWLGGVFLYRHGGMVMFLVYAAVALISILAFWQGHRLSARSNDEPVSTDKIF